MQLGCLESVANSSVAYSSSSPLTYPAPAGTEFASPYFSANHQYTPLHHQSFHYEFQHSHPAVAPEAYGLNSLHSGQYYQQIHHGEPADFINLHNARSALKSSCLDEQQRRELGCLDAYRRHDLSLMTSHGSQAYGVGMHHPDQRLLPGAGLGLPTTASDDLQVPAASTTLSPLILHLSITSRPKIHPSLPFPRLSKLLHKLGNRPVSLPHWPTIEPTPPPHPLYQQRSISKKC